MSSAPSQASALAQRLARPSRSTTEFLKSIFYRALAFGIGYSLTYGTAVVYRIWQYVIGNDGEVPFAMLFIDRTLFGLQGFFNVIVYTLPFVLTYHSEYQCTWFQAFCEVVRSGGDNDSERNGPRTTSVRSNPLRGGIAFPVL